MHARGCQTSRCVSSLNTPCNKGLGRSSQMHTVQQKPESTTNHLQQVVAIDECCISSCTAIVHLQCSAPCNAAITILATTMLQPQCVIMNQMQLIYILVAQAAENGHWPWSCLSSGSTKECKTSLVVPGISILTLQHNKYTLQVHALTDTSNWQ